MSVMQVRDDGVLNQVGSDAGGKRWSDFGRILKIESIEFADGLDVEKEGIKRVKNDSKDFGLSF